MRNYLKIALVFILMGILSCSKDKKELMFPKELNTLSLNDSIQFNPEWYNSKYKMVVYLKGTSTLFTNWSDPIEKFPEIAFLFYIVQEDSSLLKTKLEEYNFPWPVIHDPENQFFELNQIDKLGLPRYNILLLAVKDNKIIDLPRKANNPTFPKQFENYLKKFLDEN